MLALLFSLAVRIQDPLAEDIDKAVANLYSDRHSESDLAKNELIEIGRKAIPRLLAELGKQRDAEKTKQIRVRRLICEILGRIRDNAQPVLDALVARLADTDEYGLSVAAAAAGALDLIADERTAGALVTALTSKQAETDKWLKYYCIHALGVMRAASAAEALKKALEDTGAAQVAGEDAHLISVAAADALGRIRAKGAVEGLGKLLSEKKTDPFSQQKVGVHAARALERIVGESKGALEGDEKTVEASLASWNKWWEAEETKRNVAITRQRIEELATAVEAFKKDHGKYPAILEYLKDKPAGHTGPWPEGGYTKAELKDAWKQPFRYDVSGANGAPFDIVSWGRDLRAWGKDDSADVWNHDKWKAVRIEKTKKAIEETVAQIKKFKEDQERYPERLNDVVTKPSYPLKKEFPKDGYLKELPKDGFDSWLGYSPIGTGGEPFDVWSWGADLVKGGADENADVWNHDKWKAPRADDTKKKLEALAKAIEQFKKDQERYPAKLDDLKEKPSYAKKWPADGYCKDLPDRDPLTDAFGNPLVYRVPGSNGKPYDLYSLGADGKEGGTGPDEDLWSQK